MLNRANIRITIFCSFCLIISFFSEKFNSSGLTIIAIALLSVFSLLSPKKNLFYVLCFLLTSNRVLTYGPISILFIIIIIYLFKSLIFDKLVFKRNFVILIIVFILYSVQFLLRKEYPAVLESFKIIMLLVFLLDVSKDQDYFHYYNSIFMATIGAIIAFCLNLVIETENLSQILRFSFTDNGQNVLGIVCLNVGFHLLLIQLKTRKLFLFILSFLLFLIGFLTGSRTFIIGFGIGFMLLIIFFFLHAEGRYKRRLLWLIFLIIILSLILFLTSETLSEKTIYFIERIINPKNNDITNGRSELWSYTINALLNNPLYLCFGAGSIDNIGADLVAHNMFLEQLVTFGIVGSVIITLLYLNVYTYLNRKLIIKNSLIGSIPLILVFVTGMVSHTLLGIPQTVLLYIGVFSLKLNRYDRKRRVTCESIMDNISNIGASGE